jgi:hypothetical protein
MTKRGRRAGLLVVVIAAVDLACSATSPSTFGTLSIQGPEALRTGESFQFRVMRVRKDGSQEEVLGQWSVTGPYMTVQAANGMALAGSPGIAELRVSVDGIAGVQTVRVVPDMRGTWTGDMVISCTGGNVTRVEGEGPGPCKTPTITNKATLEASAQQGDRVTGTFTYLNSVVGPFVGSVGVDASWDWPEFTATAISEHGTVSGYIFKGWRMTSQTQPGPVSGSGTVEHKHTNAWGYQHYIFSNVSMTLQRLQ